MNKIESFKIDHLKLESGLYVSRRDQKGDCVVTTFDLRITAPNREPVIDMCDFVINFKGEIPGASPVECGNYSEQNLNMAKYYIEKYKKDLVENKNFEYK